MFLSFIVPVYNAENYIAECLTSLLRQDIPAKDYEILCVNDGSKDGSGAILDAFAAEYPNVIVIHKENGGVTTARNAGLAAAKGDYIWFIDADDFVKENILAQLRTLAGKANCDRLIVGGYLFLDALTEEEKEQSRQKALPINVPWYDAVVWRCLLRREFLKAHGLSFRYPELTHGEDGLFMYEVSIHAPVDAEIPEALYFYREHFGSAETTVTPANRKRKLRSYIRISKILKDYYDAGRTDAATANKQMTFLWLCLYEVACLPGPDAKTVLAELKKDGLFPCRRLPQCTLTTSYMADPSTPVGKIMDQLYLHLHTPWGYQAMRAVQQLRKISK